MYGMNMKQWMSQMVLGLNNQQDMYSQILEHEYNLVKTVCYFVCYNTCWNVMSAASYSGRFGFVISIEQCVRFNNNNQNIKDDYLRVYERYLYYLACLCMQIAQQGSKATVECSRVTSMFQGLLQESGSHLCTRSLSAFLPQYAIWYLGAAAILDYVMGNHLPYQDIWQFGT